MTRVLILCPIRNEVTRVGLMIESVLSQTCADWELLFVDNASTDGTSELIRSFQERDSRIRVRCFTESVNVHTNFRRAFSEAENSSAEFLQLLAGDDTLGSDTYLELAIDELRTPSASFVAGSIEHFNDSQVQKKDDFEFLENLGTEYQSETFAALNYWSCNLIYAFFKREPFLQLVNIPLHSFTHNLSSDWWFSLGAITKLTPIFKREIVYRKFSKGISYSSEHYTAKGSLPKGTSRWEFLISPWRQLGDRSMMLSHTKKFYFLTLFVYRELAFALSSLVRR